MSDQIREARYVIVVASPEYRRRAEASGDPSVGRGVRWETLQLKELLYRSQDEGFQKIVPVVLPGGRVEDLPDWVLPFSGTTYQIREFTPDAANDLLRLLTGQPLETDSPLGPVRMLPPRPMAVEAMVDPKDATTGPPPGRRVGVVPPEPPETSSVLADVLTDKGTIGVNAVDPSTKSRSMRLLFRGSIALAAIILLSVILAKGGGFGSKSDVTVSLEVGVNNDPSSKEPKSYVFPDQTIDSLPVPSSDTPAPFTCSGIERTWVQANGGYEAESTWARLTIFARSSPVIIEGFEIVPVVVAEIPQRALVVNNPCGDATYDPYLNANLDQSNITFEPPSGPRDEALKAAADRNPLGRQISTGESYSVPLLATANEAVYTWKLRVHVLVDGVQQNIDADAKAVDAVVRTGAQPLATEKIMLDSRTHRWVSSEF